MSRMARLVGPPLPASPVPDLNAALDRAAETTTGLSFVDAREHESTLSFATLRTNARRIAGALLARGVRPGDRVALVLPTGPDFVEAFFGILRAGAVPTPLYPPVRLGRMDEYVRSTSRMLAASGARLLLTEPRTRLLLGRVIEACSTAIDCRTVAELRTSRDEAAVDVDPEALALVQFSSGSTVDPKPVALSHRNLIAQCAALQALLPMPGGSGNVGVSWLPLYHDMGLVGCLLSAVFQPGDLVLIPPELFLARPALWLRAISRHRATVSAAPDFAYGLCLARVRDDDLDGVDLSSWTYALDGAEPISVRGLDRFVARFGRSGFRAEALMPVYGLSEASLAVTFTRPGGARVVSADASVLAASGRVIPGSRAIVSVGTPVPGAELEVRGEDGTLLVEGEVGRVWTRAPFVMSGYLGRLDATAEVLRDGWLDTGDLGFVDGGELFVCGRARDVVIVRGANHAPQEFEACLDGLEGVRTGCAVAVGFVPPDREEESLLLLVESTDAPVDRDALAGRISSAVVEQTGIRPHTVALLAPGTLPRTSSGKLRRAEALRRWLAGTLTPPERVNAWTLSRELARSAVAFLRPNTG